MHVVLVNVYPDENRGSAALTIAAITLIRVASPGCRVTLVPLYALSPSLEEFRHTLAAFPDVEILPPVAAPRPRPGGGVIAVGRTLLRVNLSAKLVRQRVAGADLVVSRGGIIFKHGDSMRTAMALWLRLAPMRYAISASVPLVLLGAHVDLFRHRVERRMDRRVFRRAARVLPRDAVSAAHASELGVSVGLLTRIPDSVFALPGPSEDRVAELTSRYGLPRGRFLAVTLSPSLNEPRDDRLARSFATALRSLLDAGRIDAVAVCVQADGPGGRDEWISRLLLDYLDDTRAALVADDLSPADLAAFYGGAAVVTGRRLHACILPCSAARRLFPSSRRTTRAGRSGKTSDWRTCSSCVRTPWTLSAARSLEQVLDDPGSRARVAEAVDRARSRLGVVEGILSATQS